MSERERLLERSADSIRGLLEAVRLLERAHEDVNPNWLAGVIADGEQDLAALASPKATPSGDITAGTFVETIHAQPAIPSTPPEGIVIPDLQKIAREQANIIAELQQKLAASAPAPASGERYRPDPYQLYRCPYCNNDLSLIDTGGCVDGYLNVCHVVCLDKALAAAQPAAEFCRHCGAGVGEQRRDGEGTCPKCFAATQKPG